MKNITVIGAGNSGLAMAACLALNGYSVNMWNRSYQTISEIAKTKTIYSSGLIEGKAKLNEVTTDIEVATRDSNLILVTTPANSHRDIAALLSPVLKDDTLIVLNPGRTFGAIEFQHVLNTTKCKSKPLIAETQTIIFTCRKTAQDTVIILALKNKVLLSTFDISQNAAIIDRLPDCIKMHFLPANSMIETSIGNVGMVLHCAPVLFNIGWIEFPKVAFKYYYNGITPSIGRFLEKLDGERLDVSRKLGKPVESIQEWTNRSYNAKGESIYDCIQAVEPYKTIDAPESIRHRYLCEDVPMGLVPLEETGRRLGLSMTVTCLVIDLANQILETDFRKIGRSFNNLGLDNITTADLITRFQ